MARIVITRPNGETEYAALTTDKTQAGNDRLAVEKAGTVYYAKLGNGVSTHMYVIQPDGRKLYVQKEASIAWKYTFDGKWENASIMVIPRTGKYRLTYNREDTADGDTKQSTETKEDIFEQGTQWRRRTKYHWYLKSKNDKTYDNYYDWDDGHDPDNPEHEAYYSEIDYIEYIGEA